MLNSQDETVLQPICALLQSVEFEDDGWITIQSCKWESNNLILIVEIRPGGEAHHQFWEIACQSVRSSRMLHEYEDSISLASDHILLLPHQQLQAELYISSPAGNPLAVVGQLWLAHRMITADWFPAGTFFNSCCTLEKLLEAGNGLLAEGPIAILKAYEKALDRHDIRHNRINEREPKRWKSGSWVPESEILKVLILGESFVVAESFAVYEAKQ